MNEVDLIELGTRPEFRARVKVALKHWAYYWRVTKAEELEALEPESYKNQRKAMIRFIFEEEDRATDRVASMVLTDPAIKALECYHKATAAVIKTAIDGLLARDVTWFLPEGYLLALPPVPGVGG